MSNFKLSIIAILLLMTVLFTPTFAQEGDADRDGVLDSQDLCPREKGTKETQGCPSKNAEANKKVVQAENPTGLGNSFVDLCVSGNCVNGKGKKKYAIGDTYEGDWVNGKREGQGTQTELLGSYTGQWKNDKYNGYGKLQQNFLLSEDDYTYEGNFVNGKREGQGTVILKNGDLYTGAWKNDKQNGYGKEYIKATMAMREGTWKDGVFVDTKAATSTPKTSNECVSGNCVNGKGKIIYTNAGIYEGDFVNGFRIGQGTYTFKNGDVYSGQFSLGEITGKGTRKYANGDTYTGEFNNGKANGYGKEYIKATNATREGTWKDGVFVSATAPVASNAITTSQGSPTTSSSVMANTIREHRSKAAAAGHTIMGSGIYTKAGRDIEFTLSRNETYVLYAIMEGYSSKSLDVYSYSTTEFLKPTHSWEDREYKVESYKNYAMKSQISEIKNHSILQLNIGLTTYSQIDRIWITPITEPGKPIHWIFYKLK